MQWSIRGKFKKGSQYNILHLSLWVRITNCTSFLQSKTALSCLEREKDWDRLSYLILKIASSSNVDIDFDFIFFSVWNCVRIPSFIYLSQFATELLHILLQRTGTELPNAKNSTWGQFWDGVSISSFSACKIG